MCAGRDHGNNRYMVVNCKTHVSDSTPKLYAVSLTKWAHGVEFAARIIENLVAALEQLLGVVGMSPDSAERNEKLIKKRIFYKTVMREDKRQVLNAASEKHRRAKNKAIDGEQSRIVVRYKEPGTLWDPLQSSDVGAVIRDDNVLDQVTQPPDTLYVSLIKPIGVVPQRAKISLTG